jgi:hypothetical protein
MSFQGRLIRVFHEGAGPETDPDETTAEALQCHHASLVRRRAGRAKTVDDLKLEAAALASRLARNVAEATPEQWHEIVSIAAPVLPPGADPSVQGPYTELRMPLDPDNLAPERADQVDMYECLAEQLGDQKARECAENLVKARKPAAERSVKPLADRFGGLVEELLRLLDRIGDHRVAAYCRQVVFNGFVAARAVFGAPTAVARIKRGRLA